MPKKSCFGGPFKKQYGKWTETLLKSEREHLYQIYWSLGRELGRKKPLLVICKILRLLINTFTADGKYSLLNRDKLTQPVHMKLSQKQKTFWSLLRQLSEKKSLLVISRILRLLVNTITADEKYSLLNRNNLMQPIPMHLSQE